MGLRCKPGDLAISIASRRGNVGMLVEVVELVPEPGFVRLPDGRAMRAIEVAWLCKSLGGAFRGIGGNWTLFPDHKLRPLRGDMTGDTEPTSTTLPAKPVSA